MAEIESVLINSLAPLLNNSRLSENSKKKAKQTVIGTKKNIHPIRFTVEEYEWLKNVAQERGVSVGEVVRGLVQEEMK